MPTGGHWTQFLDTRHHHQEPQHHRHHQKQQQHQYQDGMFRDKYNQELELNEIKPSSLITRWDVRIPTTDSTPDLLCLIYQPGDDVSKD